MKPIDGLTPEEEQMAAVFRAMGNPARVRIVGELARRAECQTSDFVGVLPLAQSTISEHLRVLKEAGIVKGTIDGDKCYCLDADVIAAMIGFLDTLKAEIDCCDATVIPVESIAADAVTVR